MRKLLLATVATCALAFPAFAQTKTTTAPNPPQATQQTQPQANKPAEPQTAEKTQPQAAPSEQQAGMKMQEINPKSLSEQQVKEIQQALNKDGFSSGHVDGIWGPDTHAAIENFQKMKGMTANGKLDEQTLSALNLKMGDFTQNNEKTAAGAENMKGAATTANDSVGKTRATAPAATTEQNAQNKTGAKPETQSAKGNNRATNGNLQNGAQPAGATGGKTP